MTTPSGIELDAIRLRAAAADRNVTLALADRLWLLEHVTNSMIEREATERATAAVDVHPRDPDPYYFAVMLDDTLNAVELGRSTPYMIRRARQTYADGIAAIKAGHYAGYTFRDRARDIAAAYVRLSVNEGSASVARTEAEPHEA